MVEPGRPFLKEVSEWREKVCFPELDRWDWEKSAEENREFLNTDKLVTAWIFNGLFERLISFVDFEAAAVALIDEEQQDLSLIHIWSLKRSEQKAFRRKIQMVFQEPISSFSPRMKIGSYLMEPRINYDRLSRKEAEREAEALLEMVGLPDTFMKRYPHELSGGQLQLSLIHILKRICLWTCPFFVNDFAGG